ncbi:MAG: HD domain-containing protein [Acidobacteria bacterium]|nr:HD domain-containing protein [Acidobacteriota bacterium]
MTKRFDDAFLYAHGLHGSQGRKGTTRPYIAHLMGVAAIVLTHGGGEDQAIAALLHDAVEDCGGAPTLAAIREKFGARVARIVEGCTDSDQTPKPPWRARKEAYIAHVRTAPEDVRLVSAADKLYNVREILSDFRMLGEEVWKRFSGRRDGSLWYYRALVDAFRELASSPDLARLVDELDSEVSELERLAGA